MRKQSLSVTAALSFLLRIGFASADGGPALISLSENQTVVPVRSYSVGEEKISAYPCSGSKEESFDRKKVSIFESPSACIDYSFNLQAAIVKDFTAALEKVGKKNLPSYTILIPGNAGTGTKLNAKDIGLALGSAQGRWKFGRHFSIVLRNSEFNEKDWREFQKQLKSVIDPKAIEFIRFASEK